MAPKRNVKKINPINYNKPTVNDVWCPICRDILIKPVTLPCSHGFCASCFEVSTQNANVVCPLCRVRISSWLRSATKSKTLVNESFWQAIQEYFPSQVRTRLAEGNSPVSKGTYGRDAVKTNGSGSKGLITKLNVGELQFSLDKGKVHANLKSNHASSSRPCRTIGNNCSTKNNENAKEQQPPRIDFATKEYTCRILCQNAYSANGKARHESLIQEKNKQLQQILAHPLQDRSNSIDSECLYFRPIDHRHNPPSEGLPPIKVPTKKPSIGTNIKIVAPSGQNKIDTGSFGSAFVKLSCTSSPKNSCQNLTSVGPDFVEALDNKNVTTTKRKYDALRKPTTRASNNNNNNGSLDQRNNNRCVTPEKFRGFDLESIPRARKTKKLDYAKAVDVNARTAKLMQEKRDFELATRLQHEFDQSSYRYPTRKRAPRSTFDDSVKVK